MRLDDFQPAMQALLAEAPSAPSLSLETSLSSLALGSDLFGAAEGLRDAGKISAVGLVVGQHEPSLEAFARAPDHLLVHRPSAELVLQAEARNVALLARPHLSAASVQAIALQSCAKMQQSLSSAGLLASGTRLLPCWAAILTATNVCHATVDFKGLALGLRLE